MSDQNCYKCIKPCVLREEKNKLFGFPCDFCKKVICSECTGALAGEIRIIPSPSRTTLFLCPSCKELIKTLPDTQKKVNKAEQQGIETAKNLEKLKLEVDSLKGSMERRKRENETIKGELTGIKKELNQVGKKIPEGQTYAEALKKLENKVENIKIPREKGVEPDVEVTLFEMKERERRANNVLFFGMDESDGENFIDKSKQDTEKIKSLFEIMTLTLSEPAKIFRLGKEMPGKKRPIKVILPNREEALKALKNRKKLEENETNIYMKPDQTETQRKYLKRILADLEAQKQEGKTNLVVRYVNGMPTIVEKREKN